MWLIWHVTPYRPIFLYSLVNVPWCIRHSWLLVPTVVEGILVALRIEVTLIRVTVDLHLTVLHGVEEGRGVLARGDIVVVEVVRWRFALLSHITCRNLTATSRNVWILLKDAEFSHTCLYHLLFLRAVLLTVIFELVFRWLLRSQLFCGTTLRSSFVVELVIFVAHLVEDLYAMHI